RPDPAAEDVGIPDVHRVLTMRLGDLMKKTVLVSMCLGFLSCTDGTGLGKQGFPAGTGDPSVFNTPDGALKMYNTALAAFQYSVSDSLKEIGSPQAGTSHGAFMDYIIQSGLLTDELQLGTIDIGHTGNNHGIFSVYEA